MKGSPLKRLFLASVLWLPAMFFVWVYFSSVFSLPATVLAQKVLTSRFDGVFHAVYRGYPRALMETPAVAPGPGAPMEGRTFRDDHLLVLRFAEDAMPPAMREEKRNTGEEPVPTVNAMIYGYGLALIWGLVLSTPLSGRRRAVQMLVGWIAIALVQAFGCVTGALATAIRYLGTDALKAQELNPELIALAYQFGYLILPAVVPVVVWMLMNRRFVEELTGRGAEPGPVAPVERSAADETGARAGEREV